MVDIDPVALTKAKSPKLKFKLALAAYPPLFSIPETRISLAQRTISLETDNASWFLTPSIIVLMLPKLGLPFT